MSKLRRLVIFVIIGLSALIVLDNARSIESTHSLPTVESTAPVVTSGLVE